jgi:hypothetical protein
MHRVSEFGAARRKLPTPGKPQASERAHQNMSKPTQPAPGSYNSFLSLVTDAFNCFRTERSFGSINLGYLETAHKVKENHLPSAAALPQPLSDAAYPSCCRHFRCFAACVRRPRFAADSFTLVQTQSYHFNFKGTTVCISHRIGNELKIDALVAQSVPRSRPRH